MEERGGGWRRVNRVKVGGGGWMRVEKGGGEWRRVFPLSISTFQRFHEQFPDFP